MFNFFAKENCLNNNTYLISGSDYNHIKNVLRMKEGESFLVSYNGKSDLCEIEKFTNDTVFAKIIEEDYNNTSLPVKIYLFQGLPKSDKMELIIQKAVELGAEEIIPTEMKRCVVKIEDKKKPQKVARWQSIAESAAKQSKRNFVPKVSEILTYKEAIGKAKELDLILVPYENEEGMKATKEALAEINKPMSVGVLIGSEGGFEESEIELAKQNGAKIISLGKRILRTETASGFILACLVCFSEL